MSIDLLRVIYEPSAIIPEDTHYYERVLEDLEYFDIYAQVYYLLKQQRKLEQTPLFFQEQLEKKYTETLYKNIFIKNQIDQILYEFNERGINVIPIKGVYFAEKYFGNIGARATSDIDILVKVSDVEEAIDIVKKLGFSIEEEWIMDHFHCSFSKQLPGSQVPLTVEIHWDLMKETTANFKIDGFWEDALSREDLPAVLELSDYHTFYLMCLHGWRHNLDSLKYFIDIIQLVHQLNKRIDYKKLLQDAANDKTSKRLTRTLSIVYREFPHLDNILAFPYKRTDLYWDIEHIRNEQVNSIKKYLDFIDYQFLSYDKMKHSLVEVVNFIKTSQK